MTRLFRGAFILWMMFRFGLDELVLTSFNKPWLKRIASVVPCMILRRPCSVVRNGT